MNRANAQMAVSISALTVGGIYAYRKLVEGSTTSAVGKGGLAGVLGGGELPAFGRFITGWGVTYVTLAIIAQAAPDLGGSMAILVAVGDILGNGTALAGDINTRLAENTRGVAKDTGADLPPTLGSGVPVQQQGESDSHYDNRLGNYLWTHPAGGGTLRVAPRAPKAPLLTNPLTGRPNPLLG